MGANFRFSFTEVTSLRACVYLLVKDSLSLSGPGELGGLTTLLSPLPGSGVMSACLFPSLHSSQPHGHPGLPPVLNPLARFNFAKR